MKTNAQDSRLHIAIRNGKDDEACRIIDEAEGDKVKLSTLLSKGRDDLNPLHLAAMFGSLKVARKILQAIGQDRKLLEIVFGSDKCKFTPLHYAARNGFVDIVEVLLEAAQSNTALLKTLNGLNKHEWTPLDLAVHGGFEGVIKKILPITIINLELRRLVFDKPYKLNPLHLAANRGMTNIVKIIFDAAKQDQDFLEFLIAPKQPSFIYFLNGLSSFNFAVLGGYTETVKEFLAIAGENEKLWKALLSKDYDNLTPLMRAASCGHKDIVILLLEVSKRRTGVLSGLSTESELGVTSSRLKFSSEIKNMIKEAISKNKATASVSSVSSTSLSAVVPVVAYTPNGTTAQTPSLPEVSVQPGIVGRMISLGGDAIDQFIGF